MHVERLRTSLDGRWNFVPDPDDIGLTKEWFNADPPAAPISASVPGTWEAYAPGFRGVAWYFREFNLDSTWHDRRIDIRFKAANYLTQAWLNGDPLGDHEGGYSPFSFDATHAARSGQNRLAIRTVYPDFEKGYKFLKPKEIPRAGDEEYGPAAGLWGSVDLIGRPKVHISGAFVVPDIRRKRITIHLETSQEIRVRLSIDDTPYETEGTAGTHLIELPDHTLWSLETPRLYTLTCEAFPEAGLSDRIKVRFGMREFTIKDQRFNLNNRPLFIKGVRMLPDAPARFAGPELDDLIRRELESAKNAGFNWVWLHNRTSPEQTLRICDELGLLVCEEPPISRIQPSPHLQERCIREVREMILRDRNHPSVVMWCMRSAPNPSPADAPLNDDQALALELARTARSIDPSRVVIEQFAGSAVTSRPARLIRPFHDDPEPFDDVQVPPSGPTGTGLEQYLEQLGDPNCLSFVSGLGFHGAVADSPLASCSHASTHEMAKQRLQRVFDSFDHFASASQDLQAESITSQIDACRANIKLAGYCCAQLSDTSPEGGAGLLDWERRPKAALRAAQEAQQPVRPLIRIEQTNLVPRQEVAVTVMLANEARLEGRAELSLQVLGPTNQVFWKKKRAIRIPKTGREVWSGSISASGSTGPHRFVVRLMKGMRILGQSEATLQVFAAPAPSEIPIHVVDPHAEWKDACRALAAIDDANALVHVLPPLANTIRAYPPEATVQMLADVHEGAVALIFSPPDDWGDLARIVDPGIAATTCRPSPYAAGIFHYVRIHPVFDGLPSRGLMGQSYRNVVLPLAFSEESDEEICSTRAAGLLNATPLLVRRYGSGRLVFAHLQVLQKLGRDPVADHLLANMLRHFGRRSIPSEEPAAAPQTPVDWLERERREKVRRWNILGMFPNWEHAGHDASYPPEDHIDLAATYPGIYRPIAWRRWFSSAGDGHTVDLLHAINSAAPDQERSESGTAYAYAEFNCPIRTPVNISLFATGSTKLWLNTRLILENLNLETPAEPTRAMAKQGKNSLLIKLSKNAGDAWFRMGLDPAGADPLNLTWWR